MSQSSLTMIGVACAVLCPVSLAGGLVIGSIFVLSTESLSFATGEQLDRLNEKRFGYLLRQLLFLVGTLFAVPLSLSLYQTLEVAGPFAGIAAMAWVFGLVLAVMNDLLTITLITRLLPAYALSTETSRPALEAIGSILDALNRYLQLLGDLLFIGIGAGLFAIAILQTGLFPRWLGWVGLLASIFAGFLYRPAQLLKAARVALIGRLGFLLFMCWLIMVGVKGCG